MYVRAPDREISAHMCEAHMCWREWTGETVCASLTLYCLSAFTLSTLRVKYRDIRHNDKQEKQTRNKYTQDGHVWGQDTRTPVPSACIIVLSSMHIPVCVTPLSSCIFDFNPLPGLGFKPSPACGSLLASGLECIWEPARTRAACTNLPSARAERGAQVFYRSGTPQSRS